MKSFPHLFACLLLAPVFLCAEKPAPLAKLQAGLELAPEMERAAMANQLIRAIQEYDYRSDASGRMLKHGLLALRVARRHGQRDQETLAQANLGLSFQRLNQPKLAQRYLERALARIGSMADKTVRLNALGALIEALMSANINDNRLPPLLRERKSLAAALGDRFEEAHASLYLGIKMQSDGQVDDAVKLYESAAALFSSMPEPNWGSLSLSYLGRAHAALGKNEAAEKALLEAVDLANTGASYFYRERACVKLGGFYMKQKQYDLAEKHMLAPLAIRTEASLEEIDTSRFYVHVNIARLYREMRRFEDALAQYRLAMEAVLRVQSDPECSNAAYIHSMMGQIHGMMNAKPACERSYLKALEIAGKKHLPFDRLDALAGLGRAYKSWGQRKQAVGYLKKALKLAAKLGEKDRATELRQEIADAGAAQ
jgi:tetratricopeptide (TPR) repeat protein